MTKEGSAISAILRVENLSIDFAGQLGITRAVDGVTLELRANEVLALVGESGSGKSVTAQAIVGLLPDTARVSGRVIFGEQDLLSLPEQQLRAVRGRRIALVFQEPSTALNPVETVGWQIREALLAHNKLSRQQANDRVVDMLRMVGIPDPEVRRKHYPHQFSGGQKQRIVIALALVNQPDVLIADEPTTALDVTVQAEILDLLRTLRSRIGAAVLLITHNMGVVADLADRVAVMRRGKIVEVGGVREVYAAPKAEYTQQLLAAVPRLDSESPAREAEADTPVFTTERLSVDYPGRGGRRPFRALHEVSVSVAAGEVLGVVGESGSGKSTLSRVAVGLLRPAAGAASVFGHSLAELQGRTLRELRRKIGVVYQDPAASLDPLRTVSESIAEPLVVHRVGTVAERRRRVEELLDSVALPVSYAQRLPRELSGGQRQRVALARALALGPELLIADEPTSALDVSVQAAVLELFSALQQELRFACLFISHDLSVVNEMTHRVVVMQAGRVIEQGPVATVLRNPAEPYTQNLLAAIPSPDPVVQAARREAALAGRTS